MAIPNIISSSPQPTTGTGRIVRNPNAAGPNAGAPITGRDAWAGSVPIGWCRMRPEDDGDLVLLVELGNAFPAPTQGFGGWDVVDLPGRIGLTNWKGNDPLSIPLPLFFNDGDLTNSVEDAIAVLEAYAGRGIKRKKDQPSILKVDCGGLMPYDWHQFPDARWVVNGLDYDDDTIVNSHGNRVRQTITVTLLQHVAADRFRSTAAAARDRLKPRGGGSSKTYKSKSGDTLMTIAKAKLGDAGRWLELQKLNPSIRDPRKIKANTTIRLPA